MRIQTAKWLQKQPRTRAPDIITKWRIMPCLLARASTCFNYRIIIVPVWCCEERRLVWTTFQDVAFDGLPGWLKWSRQFRPVERQPVRLGGTSGLFRGSIFSRFAQSDRIFEICNIVEHDVYTLGERNMQSLIKISGILCSSLNAK